MTRHLIAIAILCAASSGCRSDKATVPAIVPESAWSEMIHRMPPLNRTLFSSKDAVSIANCFIALGSERAGAAIDVFLNSLAPEGYIDGNQRAILLTLCLFEFNEKGKFGPPGLGRPDSPLVSPEVWAAYPIELTGGYPFLLADSFTLNGRPEAASAFFKRCESTFKFRTRPLGDEHGPEKAAVTFLKSDKFTNFIAAEPELQQLKKDVLKQASQ